MIRVAIGVEKVYPAPHVQAQDFSIWNALKQVHDGGQEKPRDEGHVHDRLYVAKVDVERGDDQRQSGHEQYLQEHKQREEPHVVGE